MHNALETGYTWFFCSSHQDADGTLVIRLLEGFKGVEQKYVEIGDTTLGPCSPVEISKESRVARIEFIDAAVCFSFDESFDRPDPKLVREPGRFLHSVNASSFHEFAALRTTVAFLKAGQYHEYLLWCEDRVFHVLSTNAPRISFEQTSSDVAAANLSRS